MSEFSNARVSLFTPSQAVERVVSLVQPDSGGTFAYTYKVTGYSCVAK